MGESNSTVWHPWSRSQGRGRSWHHPWVPPELLGAWVWSQGDFLPRIRARSSHLPLDPSPRVPRLHCYGGSFRPRSEKPSPGSPAGYWAHRAAVPSDPEAAWERGQHGSSRTPHGGGHSTWGSEQGPPGQQVQVLLLVLQPSEARASSRLVSVHRGDRGPQLSPAGKAPPRGGDAPGLQSECQGLCCHHGEWPFSGAAGGRGQARKRRAWDPPLLRPRPGHTRC